MLADPLIIVRDLLLAEPEVTARVADRVYATPALPPGHTYPCIRLTHVSTSDYAPVAFRHSALAMVQMDVWAYDQSLCARIAGVALDVLHCTPATGAVSVRVQSENRSLDETVQPPLHRYRADVAVRVTQLMERKVGNG